MLSKALFFFLVEPADYTMTSQVVLFPANSPPPPQMCINIDIIDDLDVESAEVFTVTAVSPAPNVQFSPGGDTASVFIADNDGKDI